MTQIEKLEQRMRNSQTGWTISDIRRLAAHYGISHRRPRSGSSHETFRHPDSRITATVPDHGKLKPVYVRNFLALVDSVKGG